MCGICGKLNFNGRKVDEQLIQNMCRVVKHRGPDDEGIYINNNIGLGHRRLSIIDLEGGHQPMSNEDETIWIVYNGEVYNFLQLREELTKKGHKFKTRSDTETIIHLYEDYGTECVKYLRGMFAFSIWDSRNERLFLARDRVGQKPLNYLVNDNSLIFASEIKAILQDSTDDREVDLPSLHHYLTYQYVPIPRTMFKGIKKLPPASILVCEKGKLRIERYWSLSYANKIKMSEEEYKHQILELLREATKLRLISEVPLGAFLSGGIDSSATCAMMAELMSQPVKTFSIGFEEEPYNELKFARMVASRFATEHHEFIVKPDAIEILPKLIWHYNEPFADSSAIPTYYVSKVTREYVTVALNGDGGDESFAGYDRYVATKIAARYQIIPAFIREGLIKNIFRKIPIVNNQKSFTGRLKRFIEPIPLSPELRYIEWICLFNSRAKMQLYSDWMKAEIANIDSAELLLDVYRLADGPDFTDKTLFVDVMTYLPNDLLVKVDIASMANSLEARSPFLDHKLMEFAACIPFELKLRGRTTKYILKKALSKLLPKEILHRSKMGFGVPISSWLRSKLKKFAYSILLDEQSTKRGYFNPGSVKSILDKHMSGKFDYGAHIWALLNLELWHRMFIDKNVVEI